MNLSNVRPAAGSKTNNKRKGRGPGSGQGKTAGRGSKGQKSGAGFTQLKGFEGGQMPLVRRLPKRGFTNIFKTEYVEVNLDRLARLDKDEIGPQELFEAGLIKSPKARIKILGRGEIQAARKVRGHRFSESAVRKIEQAGGQAVLIGKP
jgi:large subunit ribosomal protein L15